MKKMIAFLFVLMLLPSLASAIMAPESFGFYGQNQYYYVSFDAEGEAAVFARIELQNTENLTEFSMKIPGEDIDLINIVQEYYEYEQECSSWEETATSSQEGTEVSTKTCTDYISYPVYPPKYAQVAYTLGESDGMTSVAMQIPQQDQETLYLILYYKTAEYVEKNLAVYEFNFETLENKYDTNSLRVSVDLAEDLYLSGINSGIDYEARGITAESADLAKVASYISYVDTGYTETASSLDPYETFTVDGEYAKSWWALHWGKVLLGVLGSLLLIGASIIAVRRATRKNKKLTIPLLVGLASAIVLLGTWLGCSYILNNWYYGWYGSTMQLLVMLLTILMSIVLLLGPGLYFGITEGAKIGFMTFVTTVLALFILGIITVCVFLFFFSPSPGPMYY